MIKKGIYFAIATSIVSGFSIFLNKYALSSIDQPLYFTSLKNLSVGVLLLCVLIAFKKLNKIKLLKRKEVLILILIGLIGGALPFYLFFTGLSQISALNGALIHKTLVIWVAIFAITFLKERFTKTQMFGVFLLFIGNIFVGGFKGFTYSSGEALILIATILWAFENVLAKKILSGVDSDLAAFFRMFFGSLILTGATLLFVPNSLDRTFSLNATQLFWIFLTATLLMFYVLTWYRALKYAPAITVSAVLVSSTLITNFLTVAFVTHNWNLQLSFQTTLLFLGLALFFNVIPGLTRNPIPKLVRDD